jgi:hypothetical protein
MFGGLAFMVAGNMCCGVTGSDLMLRLGADGADAALDQPHVRPMDFTGRPLSGIVYVAPQATATGPDLHRWLGSALDDRALGRRLRAVVLAAFASSPVMAALSAFAGVVLLVSSSPQPAASRVHSAKQRSASRGSLRYPDPSARDAPRGQARLEVGHARRRASTTDPTQ